jgi:puromycin-sensitive aminopeptidase
MPDDAVRLPTDVLPQAYRLVLEPDLDAATFTGSVEIDCTVQRDTDRVVLHAVDLDLGEVTVESGAGGGPRPARVEPGPGAEQVALVVEAALPPGPCVVRSRFRGVLNDKLRGFYRSTYTAPDGTERVIATTQMEATDARRAFPCFDEPAAKATFEITLVVPEGLAAYSNSPVAAEEPAGPGRRRVRFTPTMKMSTYLVAFVVGELVATDPVDVDGVPVRVVHVPGREALTPFALEVAAHSLRFFTQYFGLPYPGEKVDLLAIPDFAFGAMENLGCITFRETALLVDRERAARVELERVADVVAHELAHMWFGDLVTMGWWEGIWLNEAFATFMEILCTDAFRPAWSRWVSFGTEREAALAVDGLHHTRPIEFPVGSPEEADAMFDVLTYQKGASVLRMLERYLGAETFRRGIAAYLARHAYANTVTADLWDALEAESGQPVRAVMDTWILQGGHPEVTVADGLLRQAPFAYGPVPPGTESAIGKDWGVPVLVRALGADPGAEPARLLLGTEPAPVPDTGGAPAVVNAGGWGVYRLAYDAGHLAVLRGRLGELDPLERSLLVADSWASTLAGRGVALSDFLALAAGLGAEEEPAVWTTVAGALGLCERVGDDGARDALAGATAALLGPRAADLGWEAVAGEPERRPTLRALLLATLGTLGRDEAVRAEALARFDADPVSGGSGPELPADLEAAVYEVVAWAARPGDQDYERIAARYRDPADPQQEMRALYALAQFQDEARCLATYDLAVNEVRTQNAPYLVATLLANRVGGPAVWRRLEEDWDRLLARFPVNSHSRMLGPVRSLCGDEGLADRVAAFLAAHPLASGQRSVDQAVERLGVNVAFGRRERAGLAGVLRTVAPGA